MIITITGGDEATLANFISDWNRAAGQHKDIYLSSAGGYCYVFKIIESIINTDSTCKLTAIGEIHSSAFELFFSVNCERYIAPYTFGMYHYAFGGIEINESGKPNDAYGKAQMDNFRLTKKFTLEFCERLGMTADEKKRIKAGQEVYFQEKRLRQFLKKVTN